MRRFILAVFVTILFSACTERRAALNINTLQCQQVLVSGSKVASSKKVQTTDSLNTSCIDKSVANVKEPTKTYGKHGFSFHRKPQKVSSFFLKTEDEDPPTTPNQYEIRTFTKISLGLNCAISLFFLSNLVFGLGGTLSLFFCALAILFFIALIISFIVEHEANKFPDDESRIDYDFVEISIIASTVIIVLACTFGILALLSVFGSIYEATSLLIICAIAVLLAGIYVIVMTFVLIAQMLTRLYRLKRT